MTSSTRSHVAALVTAAIVVLGALVSGSLPGHATVPTAAGTARASAAGRSHPARGSGVPAGANLVVNPGAEAGARSVQGWDAVTIPGWRVLKGLPTVVRYGTKGFPHRVGNRQGRQLFAGGGGGTAWLQQRISLLRRGGHPLRPGVRYHLSAWLGGSRSSHGAVVVRFRSRRGVVVGTRSLGAVGGTAAHRAGRPERRAVTGRLPAGAVAADVVLRLTTRLTNDDGYYESVGYDRAIADNVRFGVSAALRRPARLASPPTRVPRFDHVFLFYFENQDYSDILGHLARAPYLKGLLSRGSLLANLFAEEHPSDGNYLALAGGSAFGVPLTDPLEENPHYTIRARNIGDLLTAAHESWKGYLQSANGPCDDTVHGSYWNDDLPFLYFKDIRERPSYCAAHVVPLGALSTDLRSASTTPSFSWVGPDDCYDMEGCGVRAGDRFLKAQLGRIMASPAWTTQRSLAIITFDEDASDHPAIAQRVPTLILGSRDVRRHFVSRVRYTHYSLLRTIEAALRVGTMTRNDRYARATNDVFR